MSALSNNDIARAIYASSKDKTGHSMEAFLKDTVRFLWKRDLLKRATEILQALDKIINKEHGIVSAKILAAKNPSNHLKHEIMEFLKKRYNAKEVYLEEKLDGGLLGGVRIEANDEVIDLSLK